MKKIPVVEGLLAFGQAQRDAIIGGPDSIGGRDDVFRHEEAGGFIVDTCAAFDTHEWETGVFATPTSSCLIVEQYPDREAAKIGHDKWVQSMKDDPEQELPNIIVWDY